MKQCDLILAVNPNAAFGKNSWVGGLVKSELEAAGHTIRLAEEASYQALKNRIARDIEKQRPDGVIAVGGDGMVHLAGNLTAETGMAFGVIPAGTGNDLARTLGIPLEDPRAACTMLVEALQREPRELDALSISRDGIRVSWGVSSLSGGFDAIVNERANLMRWPKGRSRYTISILAELLRLRPLKYRITVDDGAEQQVDALLIAVANNIQFGGGMKIVPTALMDDGELDLFIVKPLSRLAFLKIYPKVFKGEHVSHPSVSIQRIKKVRLDAEGIAAYSDGERIAQLPLDVEVVPGALRVYA